MRIESIKPRRIYLASSWRNPNQPEVLAALRAAGHEVYDFRNPAPGQQGFAWRDCGGVAAADGPGSGAKTIPAYLQAIRSERAAEGFAFDKAALDWCDTCVLALPCGRSAHLELGYSTGQGKDTYVLLHEDKFEPELMYLLNTDICTDVQEIIDLMAERQPYDIGRWHEESGGHFKHAGGHAVRLLRETVELCVAAGADAGEIELAVQAEIRKASKRGEFGGNPEAIPGELADCGISLKVIEHYIGANAHRGMRRKLDVLWGRKWIPSVAGALYRPEPTADTPLNPAAAWPFPIVPAPADVVLQEPAMASGGGGDFGGAGASGSWDSGSSSSDSGSSSGDSGSCSSGD